LTSDEVAIMSVKKLGPDKFLIEFSWFEGGRRCRLRRTVFGSQKAAREWEAKLKNAARMGELLRDDHEHERPTFSEFAKEWTDTYVKANNKPSEQATKESFLRVHLKPFFGAQRLMDITVRDIERYKALKVADKLSPKTVNLHLTTLRKLFQCAVDWGIVENNPVARVAKLKDRKDKWSFLNFEEADKFMAAVPRHWKPLFLCALRTGMRQGEILGLRWQDVDFSRRMLRVENSLYKDKLLPTKSYGRRDIRMSTDLLEALLPLRNNGSDYVFPAQDGGPLHRKTLNRPLASANKGLATKSIRFHDLRHTAASHMVMAGVPIKIVQEILGHSSLQMVLRYAHVTPEARGEAVDLLEKRLEAERAKQVDEKWTLDDEKEKSASATA
jgi:integrase